MRTFHEINKHRQHKNIEKKISIARWIYIINDEYRWNGHINVTRQLYVFCVGGCFWLRVTILAVQDSNHHHLSLNDFAQNWTQLQFPHYPDDVVIAAGKAELEQVQHRVTAVSLAMYWELFLLLVG